MSLALLLLLAACGAGSTDDAGADTSAGRLANPSMYYSSLVVTVDGEAYPPGSGNMWVRSISPTPAENCEQSTQWGFRSVRGAMNGTFYFPGDLVVGAGSSLPSAPYEEGVFPLNVPDLETQTKNRYISGGLIGYETPAADTYLLTLTGSKICEAPAHTPTAIDPNDEEWCAQTELVTLEFIGTLGDRPDQEGVSGWSPISGQPPMCVVPL